MSLVARRRTEIVAAAGVGHRCATCGDRAFGRWRLLAGGPLPRTTRAGQKNTPAGGPGGRRGGGGGAGGAPPGQERQEPDRAPPGGRRGGGGGGGANFFVRGVGGAARRS